jgi:hypothetical protein
MKAGVSGTPTNLDNELDKGRMDLVRGAPRDDAADAPGEAGILR